MVEINFISEIIRKKLKLKIKEGETSPAGV